MIIGYARVSTDVQSLDGQLDALKVAGAERIFADKITGTARSRPELDRLLDQVGQLEGVHQTQTSIVLSRKIDRRSVDG